ncbi:hypothetical protein C8F04DRAFT_1192713 [Mycena alexandri]|uniref:Uncharacterized protein n=1 Tax=Mycena alexandri TaxID=1745969 RepID=A0AAD6WWU4_9AGAR|nr:hypothetical protein C8F04DRAFT_1192713 [Mycena alexandri]
MQREHLSGSSSIWLKKGIYSAGLAHEPDRPRIQVRFVWVQFKVQNRFEPEQTCNFYRVTVGLKKHCKKGTFTVECMVWSEVSIQPSTNLPLGGSFRIFMHFSGPKYAKVHDLGLRRALPQESTKLMCYELSNCTTKYTHTTFRFEPVRERSNIARTPNLGFGIGSEPDTGNTTPDRRVVLSTVLNGSSFCIIPNGVQGPAGDVNFMAHLLESLLPPSPKCGLHLYRVPVSIALSIGYASDVIITWSVLFEPFDQIVEFIRLLADDGDEPDRLDTYPFLRDCKIVSWNPCGNMDEICLLACESRAHGIFYFFLFMCLHQLEEQEIVGEDVLVLNGIVEAGLRFVSHSPQGGPDFSEGAPGFRSEAEDSGLYGRETTANTDGLEVLKLHVEIQESQDADWISMQNI